MQKQEVVNPYLLMQMQERKKKEEEQAKLDEEKEREEAKKAAEEKVAEVTAKDGSVEQQIIQLIDEKLLVQLDQFVKENRLVVKQESGTSKIVEGNKAKIESSDVDSDFGFDFELDVDELMDSIDI